eukprot:TRINITY_DN8414_c0_g1_i2.p2 TRINITY_DN8414_c0_g1~~TRINITY_DN8414_c0_g1_i2.p2  ORF type:complete len:144 (+),score=35.59 TRINITY_DN8414_c0_g1_i2:174-605(+)
MCIRDRYQRRVHGNTLESCAMAHPDKEITLESIYHAAGKPSPDTIKEIYSFLLEKNYNEIVNLITRLKKEKGLAVEDIIKEIHRRVVSTQFPISMKARLIEEMSEIEHKLSLGGLEKIQVGALAAVFVSARILSKQLQFTSQQ